MAIERISGVEQLEDMLSEPTEGVIETLGALEGDIIVLGVGGKMGPSLARMAKRASDAAGVRRRVIGVDLFPDDAQQSKLRALGVETIGCNLLDREELLELPDAPNVVFMVGMKFGASAQEALTWAINAYLPGMVCEKYRSSRIVAFSTGNIYGLTPVERGGSIETDAPNPVGEYAMSALARERVFEHFSRTLGIPTAIIRLNYAVEMRYGVLVDLARQVLTGEPVDIGMGHANVIWQGDAIAMILRSFGQASSPPLLVNVAGPEVFNIREVAEEFGRLIGKLVTFTGAEAPDALLSNGQLGYRLLGCPQVGLQQMVRWIADWVMSGGESLGKPTHFEVRDGKF
jgi:nucleoside-diphosphate-sugar epimerase